MHQLLSPIFHLEINFLTVFGLTSFSSEGFPFDLKLPLKKFHVGFRTVSFLMSRSTFRTFRIQKYINKINSDQRCTIISVNNYQLQLNFGHDMVTCLK
jgi:hypothetical protein